MSAIYRNKISCQGVTEIVDWRTFWASLSLTYDIVTQTYISYTHSVSVISHFPVYIPRTKWLSSLRVDLRHTEVDGLYKCQRF